MFTSIIFILTAAIGFMMGFLYRKSYTTAQFFNLSEQKLLRTFTFFFFTAVISTYLLSWFTLRELSTGSTDEPSVKFMQLRFEDMKSVMMLALHFFFLLLIAIANVYSQSRKKIAVAPYLLTLGFFSLFILKDAYFISDNFMGWLKSFQFSQEDLPDFKSIGWIKIFFATAVTVFNAIMIWWGLRK